MAGAGTAVGGVAVGMAVVDGVDTAAVAAAVVAVVNMAADAAGGGHVAPWCCASVVWAWESVC